MQGCPRARGRKALPLRQCLCKLALGQQAGKCCPLAMFAQGCPGQEAGKHSLKLGVLGQEAGKHCPRANSPKAMFMQACPGARGPCLCKARGR
eukprot:1156350-Pelagomonas_calceolata.AAC.27